MMGQPLVAVDTVFDSTVLGSSRNPMPESSELVFPWTFYLEDATGGPHGYSRLLGEEYT